MKTIDLTTGTLLVESGEGMITALVMVGYEYLGHPSEITGEVLSNIIDNLLLSMYKTVPSLLLTEYNIKETDVLLFKPKNS